ncbi:MAG: response regulator [Acidaminobacteraceae bacterium]
MQIEKAKNYFELSHKIKTSIISNLNHEVRTPLNIIMNTLEFLKLTTKDKTNLDQLKIIEKSSKHLLDVFENMISLSEDGMYDMKLSVESYNFHEMVSSIITYINESAMEKGLKLLVDISPDIPIIIEGDQAKISEVITHLISNAIKFTELGTILLKINLIKKEDNLYLDIVVKDTGIGISEDDQNVIFESFEKGVSNTYSSSNGLGIGLTLVKKAIELMDGNITCDSKLNSGTQFTVKIPVEIDTNAANYYIVNSDEFKGTTVLILDSHDESRAITESVFKSFKFKTISFNSLEKGIDFISNDDKRSSKIILLDDSCISSYHKASDLCSLFRSQGADEIIISTSLFNKKVLELYSKGIIDDHVVKPITHGSIYNVIISRYRVAKKAKGIKGKKKFGNYSALIADDNFINREVAGSILKTLGLKVDKSSDGYEAYQKTLKTNYDIIFMDLEMPGTDGYESLRLIRTIKEYKLIPIIAMSASKFKDVKDNIEEYNFDYYIQKPIELSALIKLLDVYFDRSITRHTETSDSLYEITEEEIMKCPYLDYEQAFERVCGDKKLIFKMLKDFSKKLPDIMNKLSSNVKEKDYESIIKLLHMLKGTCGNLGFDRIYDEIINVEESFRDKDYDKSNFDKLLYMLKRVDLFNFSGEDESKYSTIYITDQIESEDTYKKILFELNKNLSYGKIKEIRELIERLNIYEDIFIKKDIFELLSQMISRYRFKEAKLLVEKILDEKSL